MKITPTLPKENYNVSHESEERYLLKFVGYIFVGLLGLYLLFYLVALIAIRFIPLEVEQKWFSGFSLFSQGEIVSPLPDFLQERYAHLPYAIQILEDTGEENAYATLGGNMFITREFLESVEYIETLDFVIGHEIAHIEHRDMLKSMIPSLPVHIILSVFGVQELSSAFRGMVENTFSKTQETKADYAGLDFAYELNGHIGCTLNFFEAGNTLTDNILEMISTHPMTALRIERAKKYAEKMNYTEGECTAYTDDQTENTQDE